MVRDFQVIAKGSFAKAGQRTRKRLSAAVRKAAFDIEAQAKVSAPVDTGALKASIQATTTGELDAEVAVGVEYGVYVELGTVKAGAQPYLGPAVDLVGPVFLAMVAAIIAKGEQ